MSILEVICSGRTFLLYELFGVNPNTPEYAFPGPKECSDLIDSVYTDFERDETGEHSPYVIIFDVDEERLNEQFGENGYGLNRLASCDYLVKEKLLLIKVTTGPQEIAHSTFDKVFSQKMDLFNKPLLPAGKITVSTKTRKKSPDMSYVPRRRRHGRRSSKWPNFVIESGYSQSQEKVDYDAHWWLNESNSNGDVKAVVTISLQPKKRAMTIQKWNLVDSQLRDEPQRRLPETTYRTVLSQPAANEPIQVSYSQPLILPRSDIVLKKNPTEIEPDISITMDDLKEVAEWVWREQFDDPMYLEDFYTSGNNS